MTDTNNEDEFYLSDKEMEELGDEYDPDKLHEENARMNEDEFYISPEEREELGDEYDWDKLHLENAKLPGYIWTDKENFVQQPIEDYIADRIEELKSDERLTYEPATVFVNAPLALIQASKMAVLNELERLLDRELSTLPLSKEEED